MSVDVRRVGPEGAAELRAVVLPAFEARPSLEPPAASLAETEAQTAQLLVACGGIIASVDGRDLGGLVLDPVGSTMYLRRFGVHPDAQGKGVARALIEAAVDAAHGYADLTVVAREELPRTIRFWERQGFREVRRASPNVELRRPLRTFVFDAPDAESMRALGVVLAGELGRGDLIVLSGELGAGKTTLTQGIGEGLEVRGPVTSPTFVIAREHPSSADGPSLVHVDAYRLGGVGELDDLDLDTSLDDAVTVVEWGEGVAEGLAESRLEVHIIRALAEEQPDETHLDPRRVLMTPIGPRWNDLDAPPGARAPLAEKLNENILVDFFRCAESELDTLDPTIPVVLSLSVPEHQGSVLMVRNVWSREWELSGSTIEEHESARDTVIRAYRVETGSEPPALDFVGVATVQLGHERRIEFVAIYRCHVEDLPDAQPQTHAKAMTWWDPDPAGPALAMLSPIDAHLARLALDVPGTEG